MAELTSVMQFIAKLNAKQMIKELDRTIKKVKEIDKTQFAGRVAGKNLAGMTTQLGTLQKKMRKVVADGPVTQKNLTAWGKTADDVAGEVAKMQPGTNSANKSMLNLGRSAQRLEKRTSFYKKWNERTDRMRLSFKRLLMPMLGIMFFGMQIQKTFMGLITPALKMVGVFDVLSAALSIVFLPVAMWALGWAIKFLDAVSKNEGLRKFIMWVGILGAVLGTVLFVGGQFMLGMSSLLLVVMGILGPIIALAGAIGGLLVGAFSAVGSWLPGWLKLLVIIPILSALGVSVSAFSDETKKVSEDQRSIWQRIKDWIANAVSGAIGWIDKLWEKFLDWGPVNSLLTKMGVSVETIEKLKDPLATIQEKISGMWDGFLEKHPEIQKKLESIGLSAEEIHDPLKNLDTIIPKVFDKIITKGQELIKKLIPEELKNSWQSFVDSLTKEGGLLETLKEIAAIAKNISESSIFRLLDKMAAWTLDKGGQWAQNQKDYGIAGGPAWDPQSTQQLKDLIGMRDDGGNIAADFLSALREWWPSPSISGSPSGNSGVTGSWGDTPLREG